MYDAVYSVSVLLSSKLFEMLTVNVWTILAPGYTKGRDTLAALPSSIAIYKGVAYSHKTIDSWPLTKSIQE